MCAMSASAQEADAVVTETSNGLSVSVTVTEPVEGGIYIIGAKYADNGALESVAMKHIENVVKGEVYPAELDGIFSGSIFIWDDNQKPLCGKIEYTGTDATPTATPDTDVEPTKTPTPTVTPDTDVEPTETPTPTERPEPTEPPTGDGIIHLVGNWISAEGIENVSVDDSIVTISAAGEYTIDGTLNDGQIIVAAPNKDDKITVNLKGVNVTSLMSDPFSATKGKVTIAAEVDTENSFTAKADGAVGIYSKNDLTLKGDGKINVVSELGNGIRSKADIEIGKGNLDVNAYNHGIKGDNSVKITKNATNINVTSQTGDAVKSDAIDSDTGELEYDKGTVTINGGKVTLTATAGDGIQADRSVTIANKPVLTINAGGNGIKASEYNVPSYDAEGNAETVNGSVTISGGTVNVTSAEEAIRAAEMLDMSGGDVTVTVTGDAQDGIKAGKNEDAVSGSTTTTTVLVQGIINISGGVVDIKAASDDGIVSMGQVNITGGEVKGTVTADFFKVYDEFNMSDGTLNIVSGCDGIQSGKALTETTSGNTVTESNYTKGDVNITGGTINVTANGGSTKRSHSTVQNIENSCKGIKANTDLNISGGNITVNSCDDAIHSNYNTTVTGGILNLASDDDGVHADYILTLGTENGTDNDFTIDISYSYEGLEGSVIKQLSGTTYLYSTDDGVNAAGDYTEDGTLAASVSAFASPGSSGNQSGPGENTGGPGGNTGGGTGNQGPGFGQDDSSPYGMLYVEGGRLYCEVGGDGLDSNGSVEMSGGLVLVNGPTSGGNGVFDKGDSSSDYFKVTGGTLIGAGTKDMAVTPTVTGQGYFLQSNSSGSAGTPVKITTNNGSIAFIPKTSWQWLFVTTPDMTSGGSYSASTASSYGSEIFGKTVNNQFYGLAESN